MISRRNAVAAMLLATLAAGPAVAQDAKLKELKPKDFPSQPIELVVVYPAGGGMDVTARLLAKYAEKHSGERFVVTNKTGGAGMVGHAFLTTQAKGDGYTVGILASTFFADSLLRAQGKWTHADVEATNFINLDPVTFVVATDGPLKDKSIKDIVALSKEKPGTLRVGVVPQNSAEFIAEQLEAVGGGKFVPVPFQGGAPAITAVLGGHVEISFGFFAEYKGHYEAGKIRPIAVAGDKRSPNLPDVPTFNEALGAKDILWQAWRYVALPKGVPADRKAWLTAVFEQTLADPELMAEYRKMGAVPERAFTTPQQVSQEVDRLVKLERDYYVKTGRLK